MKDEEINFSKLKVDSIVSDNGNISVLEYALSFDVAIDLWNSDYSGMLILKR